MIGLLLLLAGGAAMVGWSARALLFPQRNGSYIDGWSDAVALHRRDMAIEGNAQAAYNGGVTDGLLLAMKIEPAIGEVIHARLESLL